MDLIIICAIGLAFVIYLYVGLSLGMKTKGLADMLPVSFSKDAKVRNSSEFSASTVATTISLATVVMAFFELAQYFGLWLLWTVVTTAAGLLVVRLFANKIWERISVYDHRPTLHEFLGKEFNSESLAYVGAICTSLGFLGAFAVELTVGSVFFHQLVPDLVPQWVVVIVLSLVAFIYTATGGFRAVIVTDRIQMISIWLLLLALPAFYLSYVGANGGWALAIKQMPEGVLSLSPRPGLWAFLVGIFLINVPTYISDMSIWQRIAGAQQHKTVLGGLWKSVILAAITWGVIALLACFVFAVIEPKEGVNPLILLLQQVQMKNTLFTRTVLFLATLGLYGAMLSTASTQLIAVSHTLYEDVFSHRRKQSLMERLNIKKELTISRTILVMSAIISTIFVQILRMKGFSIADLVFAIFGAQLGLCPLVIAALTIKREKLKPLSKWAVAAISAGFIVGWGAAIYANANKGESDWLSYLPPMLSFSVSSLIFGAGLFSRSVTYYNKT